MGYGGRDPSIDDDDAAARDGRGVAGCCCWSGGGGDIGGIKMPVLCISIKAASLAKEAASVGTLYFVILVQPVRIARCSGVNEAI